nr:unnamed protein product [Digitaria exilis]
MFCSCAAADRHDGYARKRATCPPAKLSSYVPRLKWYPDLFPSQRLTFASASPAAVPFARIPYRRRPRSTHLCCRWRRPHLPCHRPRCPRLACRRHPRCPRICCHRRSGIIHASLPSSTRPYRPCFPPVVLLKIRCRPPSCLSLPPAHTKAPPL